MPEEFQFEQTDEDRGELTYRCIELVIEPAAGSFTESDIEFINDIVATLNAHFDHRDEEEE